MEPVVRYYFLRECALFASLNDIQIKQLSTMVKFRRARKGDFIYCTGEESKPIYFLIKGRVKLAEGNEEGNELIKELVQPGDSFGGISFDGNDNKEEYATVMSSEAWVGSLSIPEFEQLIESNPVFAIHFVRKLASKLRRVENRYTNLVLLDVKARLISFLKDWARSEGTKQGNRMVIANPLTHHEIASIISSSRQTVTTLLNELKEAGNLRYSRSCVEIGDLESLGKSTVWQVLKSKPSGNFPALAVAG